MALRSWVVSANDPDGDFPLENLPFGVFRHDGEAHIGVAIGDQILDLAQCWSERLIDEPACGAPSLNALMAKGRAATTKLRNRLSTLLRDDAPEREQLSRHLVAMREAEMLLPAEIGDYTDFYASIHHATNVGSMFRPDNPLLPNYKWLPIGYHGRASSIVVSGTPVRRPLGQTRDDANARPAFGPSRRLDYEAEIGIFIAGGNALGEPVPIDRAEDQLFGLCIVNDWSARDIQTWEYQPLGPFLAKNFATSISPWIVTMDALEPYRVAPLLRAGDDPAPMAHLRQSVNGAFDVTIEVSISSQKMRDERIEPLRLSRGNLRDLYWTIAQLVAHHTSNGCNLRPGDLLATGTISGPDKESRGSLLERAWRGTEPIDLPTGEQRRFLEDGDEVVMRAWCAREGAPRIGFGQCRGAVLDARP
jgi:fumarylacetoacetase